MIEFIATGYILIGLVCLHNFLFTFGALENRKYYRWYWFYLAVIAVIVFWPWYLRVKKKGY